MLVIKSDRETIKEIALTCELEGDRYTLVSEIELKIEDAIDEWCEELRTWENLEYEVEEN